MFEIPEGIEVYQVKHLPIVRGYADKIGMVEVINEIVSTEMGIDAGTMVLGMVMDTLSGRSPLYRLEEFFEGQDTELLLGKAIVSELFNDDNAGRVLDRIYEVGTTKIYTECAVRASRVFELEYRYVHSDTTSRSVYGDYEGKGDPFTITYGYSKQKRPDLKQFVISMMCVDRSVPIFGKNEDGNASDKGVNNAILTNISRIMARYGVRPGGYIYISDSAMVTQDNLEEMGENLFITRLPATYNECNRVIEETVEEDSWEEIGVIAKTKPTKNRPGTFYKTCESEVELYGKTYRAVVVHSSANDKRKQKRIEREKTQSRKELEDEIKKETKKEYYCRADAEVAAEKLCRIDSEYHKVEVVIEQRPKYPRGRPSLKKPRQVKEMRYALKTEIKEKEEIIQKRQKEAGCFVLLSNVPEEGEIAHDSGEILKAYKEQNGIEQNFSFLKDPIIVNSLFLEKPERIEALGLVLLLSLLIWRLMERSMRNYVNTTGTKLPGFDKKYTDKPTSFMMTTKFNKVTLIKVGVHRKLARPLSPTQILYLVALGVSNMYFIQPRAG
jgi:transposase